LPDPVCPFEAAPEGLRVALKVVPKAARAGIAGIEADAAGRALLKVRVAEAPQGGRANAAVVKLLAKAWKLPKGALTVTAGARDRRKTLLIAGDPDALAARLRAWLAELAG
jgi:uncharacterized protein (TIGR00251 family)